MTTDTHVVCHVEAFSVSAARSGPLTFFGIRAFRIREDDPFTPTRTYVEVLTGFTQDTDLLQPPARDFTAEQPARTYPDGRVGVLHTLCYRVGPWRLGVLNGYVSPTDIEGPADPYLAAGSGVYKQGTAFVYRAELLGAPGDRGTITFTPADGGPNRCVGLL